MKAHAWCAGTAVRYAPPNLRSLFNEYHIVKIDVFIDHQRRYDVSRVSLTEISIFDPNDQVLLCDRCPCAFHPKCLGMTKADEAKVSCLRLAPPLRSCIQT